MAKFRKNHTKQGSTAMSLVRIIVFILFVGFLLTILWQGMKGLDSSNGNSNNNGPDISYSDKSLGDNVAKTFLPESSTGQVIKHKYYTLSYSEEHEQAEWVAYKLTKESIRMPNVPRAKRFKVDPLVTSNSAHHRDYTNSGYTRGHMAPAGDMAFNEEAMQESFYMSNMTPQLKECNGGIWRELEENARDWAWDNKEVYVVSGPVLRGLHVIDKIGREEVSVSDLFFKIIVDDYGDEKKAIAFLIPNAKSSKHLKDYAVTIDEVESVTGLNFFSDFFDSALEQKLESEIDASQWRFDEKRFKDRVNKWNNR